MEGGTTWAGERTSETKNTIVTVIVLILVLFLLFFCCKWGDGAGS
jgi:hypothetical protein